MPTQKLNDIDSLQPTGHTWSFPAEDCPCGGWEYHDGASDTCDVCVERKKTQTPMEIAMRNAVAKDVLGTFAEFSRRDGIPLKPGSFYLHYGNCAPLPSKEKNKPPT